MLRTERRIPLIHPQLRMKNVNKAIMKAQERQLPGIHWTLTQPFETRRTTTMSLLTL